MERYITDSLENYAIGPCRSCGGTIGHADLERREDWAKWSGDGDVPLKWTATGPLTCTICRVARNVEADVETGSVGPVFTSMIER